MALRGGGTAVAVRKDLLPVLVAERFSVVMYGGEKQHVVVADLSKKKAEQLCGVLTAQEAELVKHRRALFDLDKMYSIVAGKRSAPNTSYVLRKLSWEYEQQRKRKHNVPFWIGYRMDRAQKRDHPHYPTIRYEVIDQHQGYYSELPLVRGWQATAWTVGRYR